MLVRGMTRAELVVMFMAKSKSLSLSFLNVQEFATLIRFFLKRGQLGTPFQDTPISDSISFFFVGTKPIRLCLK